MCIDCHDENVAHIVSSRLKFRFYCTAFSENFKRAYDFKFCSYAFFEIFYNTFSEIHIIHESFENRFKKLNICFVDALRKLQFY